jgi:serine phosphatase RsbU (regulator of sigma subunit)
MWGSWSANSAPALLPRLALAAPEYVVAGTLEPAYDVGGDTFDYAAQPLSLAVSVTDAMGHGLQAALLAGLTVAALRNARRRRAVAHRAGDLADDLTVVCLDCRGPAP